jgi:GxxExxY protein
MTENELSKIVLDVVFEIHREHGPVLLESVSEAIKEYELIQTYRLRVSRQKGIPVIWKKIRLDLGFRSDLIVEEKLVVEHKSVENLPSVYPKQGLTHFKVTNLRLGLLINFNTFLLKDGIKRIVNNL